MMRVLWDTVDDATNTLAPMLAVQPTGEQNFLNQCTTSITTTHPHQKIDQFSTDFDCCGFFLESTRIHLVDLSTFYSVFQLYNNHCKRAGWCSLFNFKLPNEFQIALLANWGEAALNSSRKHLPWGYILLTPITPPSAYVPRILKGTYILTIPY